MLYTVSAYFGGHLLSANAATAKEAFSKAVEWHVVGSLPHVTISDGANSYSITEFSLILENEGDGGLERLGERQGK